MLCKLLFIVNKLVCKGIVLCICLTSRARTCNRECVKHSVLKLYKCFGRGAYNLITVNWHINHIRWRVCTSQHSVCIDEGIFVIRLKSSWNNALEDVAVKDVLLGFLNHFAEFFFWICACKFNIPVTLKLWKGFGRCDCRNYLCNILFGKFILRLCVVCFHINNDNEFFFKMIVGYNLVEKHHIKIVCISSFEL